MTRRPVFRGLLHNRMLVLIFGLSLTGAGCRKAEVELAQVSGVVTLDGQPLPDATVRFIPLEKGRAALGRTDESGRYELHYSATASGAIVGKVRVEITTAQEQENKLGNVQMGKELLPPRYNDQSELFVEVGRKRNTLDFELTSK